jgi:hypothetical protein
MITNITRLVKERSPRNEPIDVEGLNLILRPLTPGWQLIKIGLVCNKESTNGTYLGTVAY